jgi:hypothetical protein
VLQRRQNKPEPTLRPRLVSVTTTSAYTGESEWKVRDKLRRGIYRAKKSGRRTLIELASVDEDLDRLPDAKFGTPIIAATAED